MRRRFWPQTHGQTLASVARPRARSAGRHICTVCATQHFGAQVGHSGVQLAHHHAGHQCGFVVLGVCRFCAVVFEPADVQVAATGLDLLVGELAPAACRARAPSALTARPTTATAVPGCAGRQGCGPAPARLRWSPSCWAGRLPARWCAGCTAAGRWSMESRRV